jgi:hypothetical protein
VTSDTFYDDGLVRLDAWGITLRYYYFPLGTAKRIPYFEVRRVELRSMGWLSGRGRLWGTSSPGFWMPLDLGRTRKRGMVILDLGHRVKPAFTPDVPERVVELIRRQIGAA